MPAEAGVVLSITLGWLVVASTVSAIAPATAFAGQGDAWILVVYELGTACAALAVLRLRGRKLGEFGTRWRWADPLYGFLLFVAVCVLSWLTYAVVVSLDLIRTDPILSTAGFTIASATAVVIINPLFEEFFVTAYVITTLAPCLGARPAIAASAVLRGAYHTYQGVHGVSTALAMGVLFGAVYARHRRIWPLVIAHLLLDAVGLYRLAT